MKNAFDVRRKTNIESFLVTRIVVKKHHPDNFMLCIANACFDAGMLDAAIDSNHPHIYEMWSAHLTGGTVINRQDRDTTHREVKKTTISKSGNAIISKLRGKTKLHAFVVDIDLQCVWLFDIPKSQFKDQDSICIRKNKDGTFGKWGKFFVNCFD